MRNERPYLSFSCLNQAGLEVGESRILREYLRVLRSSKPLSETQKLKLLGNLSNGRSKRRLLTYYLPLVVEKALKASGPLSLLRRIEAGNRALLECFKSSMSPYDDVDYLVERAVEVSFTFTNQSAIK
jgi:hypothetical protein